MAAGLGPALLDLVDVGPAWATPDIYYERLELFARALGDNLDRAAVGKVADVASQSQGSSAALHEVAKTDALHAAAGKGVEAGRFAVTCHGTPEV